MVTCRWCFRAWFLNLDLSDVAFLLWIRWGSGPRHNGWYDETGLEHDWRLYFGLQNYFLEKLRAIGVFDRTTFKAKGSYDLDFNFWTNVWSSLMRCLAHYSDKIINYINY